MKHGIDIIFKKKNQPKQTVSKTPNLFWWHNLWASVIKLAWISDSTFEIGRILVFNCWLFFFCLLWKLFQSDQVFCDKQSLKDGQEQQIISSYAESKKHIKWSVCILVLCRIVTYKYYIYSFNTLQYTTIFKNEANQFVSPIHKNIPLMSDENELLYEMQTFVIFIIAMCTQYLNLFRTYWWQNDTYRRYAMVCTKRFCASINAYNILYWQNFHLINHNVVLLCVAMITKSFLIHLFYKVRNHLVCNVN